MGKFIDITGKKFGHLIVVKRMPNHIQPSGASVVQWLCRCDCKSKTQLIVKGCHLKDGHTKSCPCRKRKWCQKRLINLTGKRFGHLTVIKRSEDYIYPNGSISVRWLCRCDCKNKTKIIVIGANLKNNTTSSCGCQKESYIARELKSYCKKKYKSVSEYKIVKNIKTGRFLPYDIYIQRITTFIEIHGSQHYSQNKWFHPNNKKFIDNKKRDSIKRKYALKHGIYIEVDLRKIKTIKKAIAYINEKIKEHQEKL